MGNRHTIELTDTQRAILCGLVIREARRLGYGTTYVDDSGCGARMPGGRREWPKRLRQLSIIARNLMTHHDGQEG